ncbi:nucleotide disphospho-sugar-binding domain-containing protein [Allokutzneria sp. NRRL B-24872]|uniref:nucleotide disphospho-sugar-binding domain-containing protein n=1 Tax=Allokutzneria sp. NRRL B-24872 TaxID=1137961 RepID=UPI0011775D00|nr:nucleotide disphospho-sugar-binding domain-containing protein [Allokutzneria sp. NRRL B-24872]
MRVLFLPIPGIGHSFPTVPLAWALRAAGHEVLFGTAYAGVAVERAGLPVVDIGLGADQPEVFAELERRYPELNAKMRGDNGAGLTDMLEAVPVFAGITEQITLPVTDLAEAWRPDVIVHGALHGAALIAAAKLGVPSVDLGDGFGRTVDVPEAMYERLSHAFAEHGAPGLPETRIKIDVAPPSMVGGSSEGWPMRYVPFNGGAVVPDWLPPNAPEPQRPRIGVTLGSVAVHLGGLGPVAAVLEAAGDLDAEFVLALGDVDTESLGPIPPNVRIAGWVPLSALLPTCTALVHHGGGGTTLTALHNGVTQIVLPGGGDGNINGEAVDKRGAGLFVRPEAVDPAMLERVVTDEKMRSAAEEVRAEIATMPTPADIVSRLESL